MNQDQERAAHRAVEAMVVRAVQLGLSPGLASHVVCNAATPYVVGVPDGEPRLPAFQTNLLDVYRRATGISRMEAPEPFDHDRFGEELATIWAQSRAGIDVQSTALEDLVAEVERTPHRAVQIARIARAWRVTVIDAFVTGTGMRAGYGESRFLSVACLLAHRSLLAPGAEASGAG